MRRRTWLRVWLGVVVLGGGSLALLDFLSWQQTGEIRWGLYTLYWVVMIGATWYLVRREDADA